MSSSTSSFRRYAVVFGATFAVGLAAMVGMTEALVRKTLLPGDRSFELIDGLRNSRAPFAAFGDSHVANGLTDATGFENFGVASDNFEAMEARIRLRMSGAELKGIVLQADPQVFSIYRMTADQSLRIEEMQEGGHPPLAILRASYRSYLVSYFWTALSRPELVFGQAAEAAQPAGAPAKESPKVDQKEAQIRAQLHTPLSRFPESDVAQNYRRLVSELKAKGISVCMVTFPVSETYRRVTSDLPSFAQAYSWFRKQAETQDVRYLDFRSLYDNESFSDPDHLSPEMASEFTARVLDACFSGRQKIVGVGDRAGAGEEQDL